MKIKILCRYLLIILGLMVVFPKSIYANETLNCYYVTSDGKFMYTLTMWDYCMQGNVCAAGKIVKIDGSLKNLDSYPLNYYNSGINTALVGTGMDGAKHSYLSRSDVVNKKMLDKGCPTYVAYKEGLLGGTYTVVSNTRSDLDGNSSFSQPIASSISSEKFSELLVGAGKKKDVDITAESNFITCSELFSSKMLEYVNTVLSIMRWIAVGLVVVLTTIDIFNAVLSSSEDKMKKAQELAIKRLIAGVAVFLVPLFVNLCFSIAEDIYVENGYEVCEINFK